MVIAGTGHRPNKLGGYTKDAFNTLVSIAREQLIDMKPKEVIYGGALGWDMALAYAAITLGNIKLIAALPCENQESKWSELSQNQYKWLLDRTDKIVYVNKEYTVQCMQQRNIWMVDNSDLLLTMFDGSKGGTHNCIKYAESINKPIINLYSKYEEIQSRKR